MSRRRVTGPAANSALTPDPTLVARFREDFEAALGHEVDADAPIACAVSGGPDSMAMLALAAAAFPGRTIAATVDHRLRSESAVEAKAVARWCAAIGVPHATLRPSRKIAGASLQAQARSARYRLLADWAIANSAQAVLTAHHADDQAETFLMRAARGSGVAGLGGIRGRWTFEQHRWLPGFPKGGIAAMADVTPVEIVRPLLGWRRQTLREIAHSVEAPVVDDPSNADPRHDRTRFRALLAANAWLDPDALAIAARHCAEVDAELSAMLDLLRRERRRESIVGEYRIDVAGLPRELRRRIVREAIGHVRDARAIMRPQWSESANVEPLLDALEAGKSATQGGVLGKADGETWHFSEAPPRRSG